MTPAEKLALAQRSYAAFSRLDSDALIPLYHPECEWRVGSMGAAFGTEAFRGHSELREFVTGISEGVDSYTTEIVEARVTREGVLRIAFVIHTQASYTKIDFAFKGWMELEFRDGLILSVTHFDEQPPGWDDATPLDLGLTPDTGT
jgi:ketosteroid isomerase-like protein